jgi:hypothetical protein
MIAFATEDRPRSTANADWIGAMTGGGQEGDEVEEEEEGYYDDGMNDDGQ